MAMNTEYGATTTDVVNGSPAKPADVTTGNGHGHLRVAGDKVDVSILKETITFPFSGKVAPNRFLKAPMTERLCPWPANHMEDHLARGVPGDDLINLYKRWGEGQIGVIVGGNLMVSHSAVEAFGNPIFASNHDNRLPQFQKLVAAAKAHGSLFISQLSHVGRQGGKALNPEPVSASDVQLKIKWAGNEFAKPRALSVEEIGEVVQMFANSAYWCWKAGYDGVQIHCAHGYLLAQFISRTTNLRTDQYGGDLANRSRIVFEIIDAIKAKVPDPTFSISVKINSVEFQDGGTQPSDCKFLCMKFEEYGVDFVELSGGTFEARAFEHKKESTKKREAYFIEFAEMIRPHLKKTRVYVTGGFRSAAAMVGAVSGGACDGCGIGRPLSAEPYLCKEILEGKIDGALENFVPLPLNTQSSGSQLHQIGKGLEGISDWSSEEEVKRWVEANEAETQRKISILPKVDSSGYADLKPKHAFMYLKT